MAKDAMTKLMTKVNAVVHCDKCNREQLEAYQKLIKTEYLDLLCDTYGMAIHDMDFTDEGKLKPPHIHVVFRLKKRKRKSTIINDLASICDLNTLAVSVESYTSFEGSFQYLVHKNDPNKTQYNHSIIVTNLDQGEIDSVMDAKAISLDLQELKAFCKANDDIVDVIEFVGLGTYQHYRATILDIFTYYQNQRVCENVKRGHFKPF